MDSFHSVMRVPPFLAREDLLLCLEGCAGVSGRDYNAVGRLLDLAGRPG